MARTITVLNPGIGGDSMNEVLVEIPTPPTPAPPAPGNSLVKHPIVTLGGEEADDLVQPIDVAPAGAEMALPVRQVGKLQVEGVPGGVPIPVDITIGDVVTTNQGTPNSDPNSWPVHQVGSAPLPAGAATEATLATRAADATLVAGVASLLAALAPKATDAAIAAASAAIVAALGPLATQATLAAILARLDVATSTRASEATLSTANGHLASLDADIDVALSSRASETTLSSVLAAFGPLALDSTLVSGVSAILSALAPKATEATLLAAAASLASIDSDVDVALSTRASEITLAAVAASVAAVDSSFDVALSTRASESTLAAAAASLASLDADVDVALSTRASEATLATRASEATLVTANGHLASIDTDIDVVLSTRASEATLATRASEATLAAAAASLASIDADVDVALSTRASQATAAASAASLASIDADVDVALSTRNAEATQLLVKAKTDNLDVLLSTRASEASAAAAAASVASIDADFDVALSTRASQATAAAAAASLASLDADVDVALSTRASQATLAAAAASLASLDTDVDVALSTRASQATLAAVAVSVASLDTDFDVALSTRASEATLAAIKDTAGIKKITDPLPAGTNTIGKVDQGAPGASAWPSSNAAGSQVDGHSVTIGATTDADTALTVIGRLKKLVSLIAGGLPAALVGGRLDTNVGAWLGATTPTVGQKAAAASLPVVIATEQTGADNSTNSTSKVPTLGARANAAAPAWTEGNQVPLSSDLLGNLRAKLIGVVSTNNASTTPLGIAGVFTGTGDEVKDYAFLVVQVFANQASATDGLSLQWSGDNVNWDTTNGTSVSASAGRSMSITPRGRYFRVVYTNGGVAQGTFRLSTTFCSTGTGLISLPLDQALTEENLAQTVRAVLAGKDASGNFQNLTSNPNKSLGTGELGTRARLGVYGASTGRIAGTAGAQNLASIENPAASGKTVYVKRVQVGGTATSAASVNFQYRLGRTTATPTAGTTQTAQQRATADTAPVGIVRSGPTATAATGTIWGGAGPALPNNSAMWNPMQDAWNSKRDDEDIVLAAGEGLLISAEGNDTDINHTVSFKWEEV